LFWRGKENEKLNSQSEEKAKGESEKRE